MPRVYIGLKENGREIWRASTVAAECNFLVTVELAPSDEGPNPTERCNAALLALDQFTAARWNLSRNTWVFFLDSGLNQVFQTLIDHLGVEHHSYTAVDLRSGEGLSFDAHKRVVCEFYAKNWIA